MRFLADMGVSRGVVDWLRAQGHDAAHLRDEGLHKLDDDKIFEKGIAERRCVLTFDLDFGEIVAHAGDRWTSVIIFRLLITTTKHVIRRLQRVIDDSASAIEEGSTIVVEEGRHRIRRLPLGQESPESSHK